MKNKKYKISVIGGGNGGQAIAGHFGLLGHQITLYNRNFDRIRLIGILGGLNLLSVGIIGEYLIRILKDLQKSNIKDLVSSEE